MPISVAGRLPSAAQRGFTLLELLIVLVIIGIATGLAGITAFPNRDAQALRKEALRLTQLFTIAHAEARASGRPILWQYDVQGYQFLRRARALFMPLGSALDQRPQTAERFSADHHLRARAWSTSTPPQVSLHPQTASWLTGEWMPQPMVLELDDGWSRVRIVRNGAGQYRVEP